MNFRHMIGVVVVTSIAIACSTVPNTDSRVIRTVELAACICTCDGGAPAVDASSDATMEAAVDASEQDSTLTDSAPDGAVDAAAEATGGDASTQEPGTWANVTPPGMSMDPNYGCSGCNYGAQDVVVDPVRPSDLYAFICYQGVWKSTDYGQTWAQVDTGGGLETGRPWTAAIDPNPTRDPNTAPTIWTANGYGTTQGEWISTDGAVTWTRYSIGNTQSGALGYGDSLYSIDIDPANSLHVIATMQTTGLSESFDGGHTWNTIVIPDAIGFDSYVFFVKGATPNTWLVESSWGNGNNGADGSLWLTINEGVSWTAVQPTLSHFHGGAQLWQNGTGTLLAAGYDPSGNGLWRSTDFGATWVSTNDGNYENGVFATSKAYYATLSFAYQPGYGPGLATSSDGINWGAWNPTNPAGLSNGAKRAAVTNDGTHNIIVSGNWNAGLWRYVEP